MPFLNRWLIVGRLTTQSSLRIGNGDSTERPNLVNDKTGKVEIAEVCMDHQGRAYIPGSTLKGNIRSWAKSQSLAPQLIESIFGSEDSDAPGAVGGKAEFYDAAALPCPAFNSLPPYWDSNRLTGVTASVAIDRRTRTASEQKLFHQEYVPAGITFEMSISGQDLKEAEIVELLNYLEGFNQPDGGITLGASTGDGWGRLTWELIDLKHLEHDGVAQWIANGGTTSSYGALVSLTAEKRSELQSKARAAISRSSRSVSLDLILEFEANFLVNDPSQTGSGPDLPDHAPLLDEKGRPLLPSRSVRGALRSRAERILRTLGHEICYPDGSVAGKSCGPVYRLDEVKTLCSACKIFGAAGWNSPFKVSDFKPDSDSAAVRGRDFNQEFLAIDRFTGGGADKLKFNARSVYKPRLSGNIGLDLDALQRSGAEQWALGLLALVMRDLMEGDIRFGFGAAKGYGAARAIISDLTIPSWGIIPDVFSSGLSEEGLKSIKLDGSSTELGESDLGFAMQLWVEALDKRKQA